MTSNVVAVDFSRRGKASNRPVRAATLERTAMRAVAGQDALAPFVLTARAGRWTLNGADVPLSPQQVADVADALREIARQLKDASAISCGVEPARCLGEFVLFENGAIDYWLSPDAASQRRRAILKQCLRDALGSLPDAAPMPGE